MAGEYLISIARSASREIEGLPAPIVARIVPRIEALSKEPRPRNVCKLQGEQDLWRIRVGDYRVLYSIDDATRSIDVVAVRHRRDAYR